jgi:hypothetical protein
MDHLPWHRIRRLVGSWLNDSNSSELRLRMDCHGATVALCCRLDSV